MTAEKKKRHFEFFQLKMLRNLCQNKTLNGIQALGIHCSYHTNWKKKEFMYVYVNICACGGNAAVAAHVVGVYD